ncbi:MAG TPA: NADP-dependent oxidoreductase [Patescibacteria group bacterium]|nr:NADP-dependent oxidoreductase [Patescibacteria group bacterium]
MKAVQINNYGDSSVIEINENAEVPAPKENQVLVEVHAVSVNPFDLKLIGGAMKDRMQLTFPYTIGGDFAGITTETKEEVFGQAQGLAGNSGSFAEFVAVNTESIGPKPKNINFEEAAALPLVGSSAVQALEDHLQLEKGQKILIHGGAGGIGHLAIQIAKAIGAYVITTVSTKDVEFVKNLGADEVIDYTKQKFEDLVSNIDAVYDTVGGETQDKSLKILKKGGKIVSMIGQPNPSLAADLGVISIGQGTKTNTDHLTRLAKYVEGGKVKVNIEKVFQLEEAKEAFEKQAQHPQGKIVLKII